MDAEEQEILTLANDWAEAMISNDAKRIGSFMSDDWVIVSERGVATRERFLSFVESGALTHTTFDLVSEPRIKFYGDTAVLTARVVNTAHFGGQQFDQDEWASDVFVRRDGHWYCVLSHIASVDKEFLKQGGSE